MNSEEFDARLRGVLKREDPPEGFAERVITRAHTPRRGNRSWFLVAAIAAMLAVAFLVNREMEQRRAEEAHRQAVLALRITAEKLNVVRSKVLARQARVAETENP